MLIIFHQKEFQYFKGMRQKISGFTIYLLFLSLPNLLHAQIALTEWRSHLPYSHGIKLTATPDKIFCATESAVFSYNKNEIDLNNKKFKVLYPTSATYLISCVVDVKDSEILTMKSDNFEFKLQGIIIDTKCYHYETDNKDEAYYLCAILNSNIIDNIIKPMQSQGKWGPRDIHKKVLEIPIPKFNKLNSLHLKLSSKGKILSSKVLKILPEVLEKYEGKLITGSHIGHIRSKIKKEIELELNELDDLILELFKQISKTISKRSLDAFLKK